MEVDENYENGKNNAGEIINVVSEKETTNTNNHEEEKITTITILNEIMSLREKVQELSRLVRDLEKGIQKNGDKMNGHIDFVEKVYSTVRHPLDFFKKKIEYVMGRSSSLSSQESLPQLIQHPGN